MIKCEVDILNADEFILSNLILERKVLFCRILRDAGVVLQKKRLKQPFIFTSATRLKNYEKTQDFLIISLSQIEMLLKFCKENPTRNDKFAKNYKQPKITRVEFLEQIYRTAKDILENKKDKFKKNFSILLKKT